MTGLLILIVVDILHGKSATSRLGSSRGAAVRRMVIASPAMVTIHNLTFARVHMVSIGTKAMIMMLGFTGAGILGF